MPGSHSRTTELPPDEYLTKEEVLKLWGIVQDRIDSLMANGRDAVSNLTEDRDQEADPSVGDDVGVVADIRAHDRNATSHRFQQNVRCPFEQ